MEDIHGVDVSWLHHSTRDHHHRTHTPETSGPSRDGEDDDGQPDQPDQPVGRTNSQRRAAAGTRVPMPVPVPAPAPAPAAQQAIPPSPPPVAAPVGQRRPPETTLEPLTPPPEAKPFSRRGSWITSLSSKFSSQHSSSPAQTTPAQAQGAPATANAGHAAAASSANGALNGINAAGATAQPDMEPYVPQPPKGSFISNALRRLSSGSQIGGAGRGYPPVAPCPRRLMNIDPHRDRCLVPELNPNKLRRVAFCVDVEIAGGPRYKEDMDAEERRKKTRDKKLKEKGEAEALKHPDAVAEEKDHDGIVSVDGENEREFLGTADAPNPEGTVLEDEKKQGERKKKEKKKRSEAERKERKEKKRRKAEECGCVPLELTREEHEDGSSMQVPSVSDTPAAAPAAAPVPAPRPQYRPTTDPLRIYRRCCQLRETPALKRITDQLSDPKTCSVVTPGVVSCLDLSGSRMQLADVVTFSDWLAVVPVKKLLLEDAELNDDKVRLILAGLLAAKIKGPPKRRSVHEKDTQSEHRKVEERPGVVHKLVLKNNPKIGPEGWRHISLFIYMCKSIQAIDVSMIPFPNPKLRRPTATVQSDQKPSKAVADIFSKAIAERLGGAHLEELVMAECSLTSSNIRKIIDGVVVSGVQRLGLATNDIDSEGFDHVIHYINSGVCQGLDLGGNDLQGWMGRLAESITGKCLLWALSLADCDLTPESLRVLFPALVTLPNFRFLDLSHNRDLFVNRTSLCLLRKYVPQMNELRRIHLADVSLSPEQAIGLAEVLPECAHLAHLNILENPQITNVATATDGAPQEDAVALYASLMVAAKLSRTLICVDVDVPGSGNSPIVKALARQVDAFCLRNMETFSEIPELNSGVEFVQKEVEYPPILQKLVLDGLNTDIEPPTADDDDYIVGSTGVVKALSYCLLQKATDLGRQSRSASGATTPQNYVENDEDIGKAKKMSKDLLEGARAIRTRLQRALVREARTGNNMGYRRLLFLDQTLHGMIQRFEDEYPETRLPPSEDASSIHSSILSTSPPTSITPAFSTNPADTAALDYGSDEDEPHPLRSRHNSDVSLASRALSLEEGRLHRFGHRVRTEIINASRPSSSHSEHNTSGTLDEHHLPEHMAALRDQYHTYSGEDLRQMAESIGWEKAFDRLVENAADLKSMMREDPEEFAKFKETQIAALRNRKVDLGGVREDKEGEGEGECAVED